MNVNHKRERNQQKDRRESRKVTRMEYGTHTHVDTHVLTHRKKKIWLLLKVGSIVLVLVKECTILLRSVDRERKKNIKRKISSADGVTSEEAEPYGGNVLDHGVRASSSRARTAALSFGSS